MVVGGHSPILAEGSGCSSPPFPAWVCYWSWWVFLPVSAGGSCSLCVRGVQRVRSRTVVCGLVFLVLSVVASVFLSHLVINKELSVADTEPHSRPKLQLRVGADFQMLSPELQIGVVLVPMLSHT